MKKILVILLCGLCLNFNVAPPAVGQSTLERLERQIRRRDAKRDRAKPAVPPPPTPRPAGGQAAAPHRTSPYLGVVADDKNDRGRGVRIVVVRSSSPAERAGLRRDDLITSVGGVRVRQLADFTQVLDTFSAGKTIDIEILRGENRLTMRPMLGEPGAAAEQAATSEPPPGGPEEIPVPPAELAPALGEPSGPALSPPAASSSSGDSSRVERLERRIEQLERRIAQLERRIDQLDREAAAARKGR